MVPKVLAVTADRGGSGIKFSRSTVNGRELAGKEF